MAARETRARRRAWLREARAVIQREYCDPDLTLADVAAAVGVSPRHLQRVFREEAVESFRAYLLRVRMKRAAELLSRERNPVPIHAAARRVGYRQASGLRQAFVRFYGHSPSEIQAPAAEELYAEVNLD